MTETAPDAEPQWPLTTDPSAGWLRRRAKLVKRAYADPGHPRHDEAVALVATYDAPGGGPVALPRAQDVLARAFGATNWSGLTEQLPATDGSAAATTDEDGAEDPA